MQVKWLKTALRNLDHEAEYIASSDPDAAKKLVATIFNSVDNLKINPSLPWVMWWADPFVSAVMTAHPDAIASRVEMPNNSASAGKATISADL